MTNALLRQACEVAGLRVHTMSAPDEFPHRQWCVSVPENADRSHTVYPDHPMLPAYVASLLVARLRGLSMYVGISQVSEADHRIECEFCPMRDYNTQPGHPDYTGQLRVDDDYNTAIIRAALAVLAPEREGE